MVVSTGIKTKLHHIELSDAADIIKLRNNPQINRFLSSSRETTLQEQLAWMEANAKQKNSIYLKITDLQNHFHGTISLYEIEGDKAEFGRYICTNPLLAIESEYLILKYGFEVLNLQSIYCRTKELNKPVWNQHYKFGFKDAPTQPEEGIRRQEIGRAEFAIFDYGFIERLASRM